MAAFNTKTDRTLPLARSISHPNSHSVTNSVDIIFPKAPKLNGEPSKITEDLLAHLPANLRAAIKMQEAVKAVLSPENYSLISHLFKETSNLSPYSRLSDTSLSIVKKLSDLFKEVEKRLPVSGDPAEEYPLAQLLQKPVSVFKDLAKNIETFNSRQSYKFVSREEYTQERNNKLGLLQKASAEFMSIYGELKSSGLHV